MAKSELKWSSITRADMSEGTQVAFDVFIEAKAELEAALGKDAVEAGAATQGDAFAFAYRGLPDNVGMAITGRAKAVSGFAGLAKAPRPTLAQFQAAQDASGHRR